MKRKLLLMVAGLFFLFFLGMAWFGGTSVARRLELMRMESFARAAEAAARSGRYKEAILNYQASIAVWQRYGTGAGYFPYERGGYLVAGNCYRKCYNIAWPCDVMNRVWLMNLIQSVCLPVWAVVFISWESR